MLVLLEDMKLFVKVVVVLVENTVEVFVFVR